MGTDVTTACEYQREDGVWVEALSFGYEPFSARCYGVFAFLAGVRNYSGINPIVEPRGKPEDYGAATDMDYYNYGKTDPTTWLFVSELEAFNYDAEMEDRRVTIGGNGGCTCAVGEGVKMTWREFLGESFFVDLERLVADRIDRVVFWFD